MDEKTVALIERIKEKIGEEEIEDIYTVDYPPVPLAEVKAAERRLGFRLPELLKVLYTEVRNGGFGPYDGIVGLEGGWGIDKGQENGLTLVKLYEDYQNEIPFFPLWRWPGELLPICEDGHGVICLDCTRAESPVISFEILHPDIYGAGWELKFRQEAPSFQRWLENWAYKPHPNRK